MRMRIRFTDGETKPVKGWLPDEKIQLKSKPLCPFLAGGGTCRWNIMMAGMAFGVSPSGFDPRSVSNYSCFYFPICEMGIIKPVL